jgi:hypothetical protein
MSEKAKSEAKPENTNKKIKKAKINRPLVQVRGTSETEKRSFTLSKSCWDRLDSYAEFLTDFNGTKISSEQILEARIDDLKRDRAWTEWRKKKGTDS